MSWNGFKYKRATIRVVLILAFMAVAFFLGRSLGESARTEPVEASVPPSVVIENNNFYSPSRPSEVEPTPEVNYSGPSIATQNAFGGNGSVK